MDQLTGDERVVHEVALTEVMVGLCVLARVVDHRGFALLAGCHPHPLRPLPAGEVVEIVKAKLRRRRNIPRERLNDEKVAGTMLAEWTLRVLRDLRPPELRTGDGDATLFTTERWTFEPAAREAVLSALLQASGTVVPDDANYESEILFLRESHDTILGSLRLDDSSFEVSTISLARADQLRDRTESACGNLIRRGLRSHNDPMPELKEAFHGRFNRPAERGAIAAAKSDDSAKFLRRYKEEYYTRWLDEPVPALDDQTPREASKTTAGRRKLIPLLDDLAYREGRLPEAERFDLGIVRKALGLERKQ